MVSIRSLGRVATVVLMAGAAVACGSSDDGATSTPTTTAGASAPVASDAWCRTSPARVNAGACYLVIRNDRDEAVRLVGATVPAEVAAKTELHETVVAAGTDTTMAPGGMSGPAEMMPSGAMPSETMPGDGMSGAQGGGMGMMEMREVDGIDVPAGGTVRLEPGGYHVMLLDLVEPLVEGQTIPITLRFEGLDPVNVVAEVRSR